MERLRTLIVLLFLCNLSSAQSRNGQHRTRLRMEIPSTFKSQEPPSMPVPSLAPYPTHPAIIRHSESATAASSTRTASIQQSISPPVPAGSINPSASSTPNPSPRFFAVSDDLSFGEVGVESNSFRRACKNFCEKNSKRKCLLEKKPKIYGRCKQKSRLGSKSAPFCCFYIHCLRFRRPHGQSKMWWKHTSARRRVLAAFAACK